MGHRLPGTVLSLWHPGGARPTPQGSSWPSGTRLSWVSEGQSVSARGQESQVALNAEMGALERLACVSLAGAPPRPGGLRDRGGLPLRALQPHTCVCGGDTVSRRAETELLASFGHHLGSLVFVFPHCLRLPHLSTPLASQLSCPFFSPSKHLPWGGDHGPCTQMGWNPDPPGERGQFTAPCCTSLSCFIKRRAWCRRQPVTELQGIP